MMTVRFFFSCYLMSYKFILGISEGNECSDACVDEGKYISGLSSSWKVIIISLDVRMKSPPASPPRFELAGASRVTGGILRGRAYGNVYNHADAETNFGPDSRTGKVHVYTSRVDPTLTKPDMVLKHKVTPKLTPILKALARGYSPVRSKLFIIF